jgi:hypothetical protein
MAELNLFGVVRGTTSRATIPAVTEAGPADLVERAREAAAPNPLGVDALTYAFAWAGTVPASFVIDARRRLAADDGRLEMNAAVGVMDQAFERL